MNLPKKLLKAINLLLLVMFISTFLTLIILNIPKPNIDISVLEKEGIATRTRIIDGDTIELTSGEKVRYIGIDTPEKDECFYTEAKIENQRLLKNSTNTLVEDRGNKDRYGRLLRYVYVSNCHELVNKNFCEEDNTLFINKYLIQNGFATLMQIEPNTKYKNEFAEFEKQAKEQKLGLWGKCY
jgi:micrococcal nuclease